MITIYLNDKAQRIEPSQSLHNLLMQNSYTDSYFAVAINNKLVARANYKDTMLNDCDRVDIIVPMQGG
ncbi:sulfur carrier protein ThiS [Legionella spiritensis]|uniref:Thiamine biosynthesis sulfur transport protein ThiS n=1 Tax=Legionella spiritensis TaxID=452 RepID=A0A0W0Z5V4_LEGSP|nr:sulfur carrier protein ThiS [Legionella spiritensis]KTD64086.1 Thiamine biosynthesis sulfur transport protein ThiS [Legionella spiritensis]SNV37695.1 Thiamine biosynthesis sulfur transport protein ThiS [Legionella spiritensis]VEG90122.1 Thiamine biosynthesis sulfur transport protein ThiS [Legionella spiritensis]